MNGLDWLVLLGTMLGIAAYGMWATRGKRDLNHYLHGDRNTRWIVIGLSVMATQASAVTFLSTPGQGYMDGLGFIQNYIGAPIALLIVSAVFLPIYRKLDVYTAYEYLGKRFDKKTRLLGAGLFLVQRGIGAGLTVYAPAIVLSSVLGWRLDLTIILSGSVVIIYTVTGGSQAVTLTQKYQFLIIIAGMLTAFFILLAKLPADLTFNDAMALAGNFHKLKAIDYSIDYTKRYTIWSGLLGGMFLALSYFGTDQTQVQRYLAGASLRESRLGLMFNAVFKIPMQFFILLLGCMLFVFYQFEKPPMFFGPVQWKPGTESIERQQSFDETQSLKQRELRNWLDARHKGDANTEAAWLDQAARSRTISEMHRDHAKDRLLIASRGRGNEADYIFITFILDYLPHGLIGLLIAVFFAATLSSKAGELNALASTTIIDVYRHLVRPDAPDEHYVVASKVFTVFWGVAAICFALSISMAENLIQYGNIIASLFYGVILGLFIIAFFFRDIGGTAVFWSAIAGEAIVLLLYFTTSIGYLWYNVIGPVTCVGFSVILHLFLRPKTEPRGFPVIQNSDV